MAAGGLRIAILSVHSCPEGSLGAKDTGGMNVYVREIARELGKQGVIADVYTRAHDPKDEPILELGNNARLIHIKAGDDEDIHKLAVYCHLPQFACNLENFRKSNGLHYDLVFSHYWLSGWVGQYLQGWWDVPHAIVFHTLGAVKNAIGIGEEEPELRIETEKRLCRDCQRIIATTEKEREELIRNYGTSAERVSIISCGVNLELFQPMGQENAKQRLGLGEDKIALFVGRMERLKGLDQLLMAMTYLRDIPGLRLVIIGGDEHSERELDRLQKLSRELNIGNMVTFLGLVEQRELPWFYSAANVCVVPSYYESFGLVALESMACGTPVVVTDVGGLKNIVRQGKTGYVVADNSPQHLADKIALLLSTSRGIKPASSIRGSVAGLSWSHIARNIIKECQALIGKHFTVAP